MAETGQNRRAPSRGEADDKLSVHLVFDVEDHTQHGLEQVHESLKGAEKMAEGLNEHLGESQTHAQHMSDSFMHMREEGRHMVHIGHMGMQSFERMAEHAIHAAAEFDDLRAKMQFAYGEGTREAFNNLRTFEQNSAYSMAELTESVAALRSAFRGIDPTDLTPRFRTATGQMESGLEALSDAAAGAGVSLGDTIQIVERALEGNYQSIAYQMRLSGEEVDAMRARVGQASDEQEKYNAIVETLASHWGGAQRTMGGTFGMLQTRLRSITHLLWAELGEKGLEPIKELMDELHTMFRDMLADREFIEAVGEGFKMVGQAVLYVGRQVIHMVTWVRHLARENPGIIKFAAGLWAIGSAMLVAVGHVMALGGSLGLMAMSLQTVGVTLGGVMLMLAKAAAIIVVVGAAISVLWRGVKSAWERDLGGIRTFIERVVLVVRGLYEAFSNWGRETTDISEETARGLHRAGILDWFVQVVGWVARAQRWFEGLWAELKVGWAEASPALIRAWRDIETAFNDAWASIRATLVDTGLMQDASATKFAQATTSGAKFGQILNEIVVPTIRLMAQGMKFVAWVIKEVIAPAISWVLVKFAALRDFFTSDEGGQAIVSVLRVLWFLLGVQVRAAVLILKGAFWLLGQALSMAGSAINDFIIEPLRIAKSIMEWFFEKWQQFGALIDGWTGGRFLNAFRSVRSMLGMASGEDDPGTGLSRAAARNDNAINGTEDLSAEELAAQGGRPEQERSFDEYAGVDRSEIQRRSRERQEQREKRSENTGASSEQVTLQTLDVLKNVNMALRNLKVPTVAIGDEAVARAAINGATANEQRLGVLGRE